MELESTGINTDSASSSSQPSQPARPRPKPARQRDKPQLSCNACRRRKSRCDRRQPCSCCSDRGQICTYVNNVGLGPSKHSSSGISGVHDRLAQLERLVMSSMDSAPGREKIALAPEFTTSSKIRNVSVNDVTLEPADSRSECGSMRISESELLYLGGDHWVAILEGIADLKDHIDRQEQLRLADTPSDHCSGEQESDTTPSKSGHVLLLYGHRHSSSRDQIIASLPPKPAVDRYVSRYFNYLGLVSSSSVHGPTFLREYEAFWKDPSSAPIMWIGLLFSMICLACLTSTPDTMSDSTPDDVSGQTDLYREIMVQCLITGEYTKSGPYALETIINYTYAEFCVRKDADKDIWFLLALEVNLAMRMGYHRDPSHFPGISPFQGEMRRRLWATVLMSDILISSQMGMPRMISDEIWDTLEPRNLNDADFDAQITELPPSRPLTDFTNSSGLVARRRIITALGTVMDLTNAVNPCSYADVMRVDKILQEAAESIPPPLKFKPIATSMTDSPQIIMARLFLRQLIYKGQIILHRRFLYPRAEEADDEPTYQSQKICLEASLGTLEIQHILDEETCPGGQLHTMQFRVTSIMNHQFLTATMILCSMLRRGKTLQREQDIRAALQKCRAIWMRKSAMSKEAEKAAATVNFVISEASDQRGLDMTEKCEIARPMEDGLQQNSIQPDYQDNVTSGADDESTMFPEHMSLFDPDYFVMPGFIDSFTPPEQQSQGLQPMQNWEANFEGGQGRPSDWMLVNWPGV